MERGLTGRIVSAYSSRFRLDKNAVHAAIGTRPEWGGLSGQERLSLDAIAVACVFGLDPDTAAAEAVHLWDRAKLKAKIDDRRRDKAAAAAEHYLAIAGCAYGGGLESRVCAAFGLAHGGWFGKHFGFPWKDAAAPQCRALVLAAMDEAEALGLDIERLSITELREMFLDPMSNCRRALQDDAFLRSNIDRYVPCDVGRPGLARTADPADPEKDL